ncbi:MAG: prolyl oligopeptidase family serine peptidase [Actinomycetota bacterium]
MADPPAWERRFTAVQIGFPSWSDGAADHLAFVSNESGSWQAWTTDLATGERRQVSDEPVGVEAVLVAPDGRVVWWQDDTGDQRGRWVAVPFGGGTPKPLVPGAPRGWSAGISFAGDAVTIGIVTEEEYIAIVAEAGSAPRTVRTGRRPLGVGRLDPPGSGGISADGQLICLRHAESGDIIHQALMVLDAADGTVVATLVDAGSNLDPTAWASRPGDDRLLFTSELGAWERPAIWTPRTGERRDLVVDLLGAAIPVGWWPDGSAILVRHEFEGSFELHRLDLDSGRTAFVAAPKGEISAAGVRPDGRVWFETSDSVHPPRIVSDVGDVVLAPIGEPAPAGTAYRSFWFENPHGQRIQAIVATPPGEGPHPTVMSVHGGPEWHERDAFDVEAQAFLDAGYAVALVNYRGSTGYGIAFRRALVGDPWFPESEDVIAGLDALIDAGITDPDRVAFSGWSWGGCLACLNAGLHPERWKAVFAGIPSGDFVAAHYACMPEIQAYDVALYGGTPDEVPGLYRERNPMTYVDRVIAPVLIIAGEEDPQCPIEGITPWADALRSRGVPVDVHLYPQGHHANAVDQQVHHMQLILDFFGRHV